MGLIMLSDSFGAFMGTKNGFKKLEGFSRFDFNPGAQSYIRKYFSASAKSVDIAESLCEISYTYDRMIENPVHDELSGIADCGLVGKDAIKDLVFVDFSAESQGRFPAFMQSFTVKCTNKCPEEGFLDYSGCLIARGPLKKGYFVLNSDLKSGKFIAERKGILCD